MKAEQLITWFDVVSFIVGIVSIVLAIVSLVLSVLFYKWGKEAGKLSSQLTTNIEAHTNYLKDLFDQMLKTSFEMIRDHNNAMDRRFLDVPGTSEEKDNDKIDIDLFCEFLKKDQFKVSELADKYHVDSKTIENVANKISQKGNLGLNIEDDNIQVVSRCFFSYSSMRLGDSGNETNENSEIV